MSEIGTELSAKLSCANLFHDVEVKSYVALHHHLVPGLLHCLLRHLSVGESLDLLVLKELLGRMGGCETLLEVSEAQMDGLAGGRSLRAAVGITLAVLFIILDALPRNFLSLRGLCVMFPQCMAAVTIAPVAGAKSAVTGPKKAAIKALREALISSGTALPLLLYIAQVLCWSIIYGQMLHIGDIVSLLLLSCLCHW